MRDREYLNDREEALLFFLWDTGKPLTVGEMLELLKEEGWNYITLNKTVQYLSDEGYLSVSGVKKISKTYARILEPAITREEYFSGVLKKRGMDHRSLSSFVLSFLGVQGKEKSKDTQETEKKLEGIIEELYLKAENTKEK